MPLEIRTSSSYDDYVAAAQIAVPAYYKLGLVSDESPHQVQLMAQKLSGASATTFLAIRAGKMSSTVSLFKDGLFGLPMDKEWFDELSPFRERGESLMEAGVFATCNGKNLCPEVVVMLSNALSLARRQHIDYLVANVSPKHYEDLYQGLGFKLMGDGIPKPIGCVNNRLGVGIYRSVEALVSHRYNVWAASHRSDLVH